MAQVELSNGLVVETPDGLVVTAPRHAHAARGPRPAGAAFDTGPIVPSLVPSQDALVAALGRRGFSVFDSVVIEPGPWAFDGVRTAASAPSDLLAFEVPVDEKESAVVLLEQDGAYSWHIPDRPAPSGRRSGGGPGDVVRIEIGGLVARRPSPAGQRGIITDLLIAPVRAYVLKFAARLATDAAVSLLERDVKPSLVVLGESLSQSWSRVDRLGDLDLPVEGAPRILLLIHGTFSSTVGSFAALVAFPWGRALLKEAAGRYDAVVGYDHPTLSVGPHVNVDDLLRRLEWTGHGPIEMDIIAFSRGGLVARSLLLRLDAEGTPPVKVGRTVFVGVPNKGTTLAEPDNWGALIDIYTNVMAAACRLIGLLLPGNVVTDVLEQAISGLGEFVRYVSEYALDQNGVPGLAAMCPTGAFITELNGTRARLDHACYAIVSEFEARVFGDAHEPQELPKRLLFGLLDHTGDRLMGGPNDLVINTESMSHLGTWMSGVKASYDFGTTPFVYHTVYFARPEVCCVLARWLELDEDLVRTASGLTPPPPRPATLRGTPSTEAPSPERLVRNITVMPADATVSDLRRALDKEAPSYVVLQRIHNGNVLHYALARREVTQALKAEGHVQLGDYLGLHESDASPEAPPEGPFPPFPGDVPEGKPQAQIVVVDDGRVVGVLTRSSEHPSNVYLVTAIAPPMGGGPLGFGAAAGAFRGGMGAIGPARPPMTILPWKWEQPTGREYDSNGHGTKSPIGSALRRIGPTSGEAPHVPTPSTLSSSGPRVAGADADAVTLQVLVECRSVMEVGRSDTVIATVSREDIHDLLGAMSAGGIGTANLDEPLTIELWARSNVEVSGNPREDIAVPAAKAPSRVAFTIKPTAAGTGELTVLVHQNRRMLATLRLRFRVEDKAGDEGRRTAVNAVIPPDAMVSGIVPQLLVMESGGNGQTYYQYLLQLPGVFEVFRSKVIQSDRNAYVNSLYDQFKQRWTGSAQAQTEFRAELEAFGAELYDALFPPEMQRILWEKRDLVRDIVVVALEEPFIPWELVYVKEPGRPTSDESFFLAERGMVRWLTGRPMTTELRMRDGKVRSIIPQYVQANHRLRHTADEAAFLIQALGAVPVDPYPEPVRTLLRTSDAFDVLHFAGHGLADTASIRLSRLLLQERHDLQGIVPTHFQSPLVAANGVLDTPEGRRPIVVLNACQTGRAGPGLTGIGGFADGFLKAGAGCFVGTLWSVNDEAALKFSKAFYSAMKQGKPLAEAATEARVAAKGQGDASWLAYTVYGHPRAKVMP